MTRLLLAATVLLAACVGGDAPPEPHALLDQGACADCHEDAGPRSHDAAGWELDHGRAAPELGNGCATCHAPNDCADCHARAPETHTAGFRRPGAGAPGGDRHAVLGRLAPSTCLTCHRPGFAAACIECHTLLELEPWEAEARQTLHRWQPLLEGESR